METISHPGTAIYGNASGPSFERDRHPESLQPRPNGQRQGPGPNGKLPMSSAFTEPLSAPAAHRKVMHAIEVCRTEALGGHLERCDSCGFERPCFHSCLMGSISLWGVGSLNDARSKGRTRVQLTITIWLSWLSVARSVCPAAGMILSAGVVERQPQWPRVSLLDRRECRFQ